MFFVDIPNIRIHKFDPRRKATVFKEDAGKASGLMFGPDGRLYVAQSGRRRIFDYSRDGKGVVNEGIGFPNGDRFSPDESLLPVGGMVSKRV